MLSFIATTIVDSNIGFIYLISAKYLKNSCSVLKPLTREKNKYIIILRK